MAIAIGELSNAMRRCSAGASRRIGREKVQRGMAASRSGAVLSRFCFDWRRC